MAFASNLPIIGPEDSLTSAIMQLESAAAEENKMLHLRILEMWDASSNAGFKRPKFEKYDGHGYLAAHLKQYCNQLRGAGGKEELLMAYFWESLTGIASEWYTDQEIIHWHVWDDMARDFVRQFQYNVDIAPDRNSLSNLEKKTAKSFRKYAVKWREQASRVKPPMDEIEMVTVFLEALEADYFQNMMSAMEKPFDEAIKIGEMVENGLKTDRILSHAAFKATSLDVQNGSEDLINGNGREEGAIWLPAREGPAVMLNADFNNMTCLRTSCPDPETLSDLEIMNQELDCNDDKFKEINKELKRLKENWLQIGKIRTR
ncbi:uncharacterized protein [Nicotiana sylvestris]|uniref:uncharacterized protein n=1 Tax=Nicotiana sylvestris TaxID=4096 RepID=UPI00388C59EE